MAKKKATESPTPPTIPSAQGHVQGINLPFGGAFTPLRKVDLTRSRGSFTL